jgi:proline iminopeptidase
VVSSRVPSLTRPRHEPTPVDAGWRGNASLVSQALRTPAGPDARPALAGLRTPALVVKGSCDYLPWSTALDYRAALPGAQLVYLRGAGHGAHGDQPASYLAVVRAFLQGKQLPISPYAGDAVPGDYQGPK